MSIKLGDIDVLTTLIETEFRLTVLEQVMDVVLTRMPIVGPALSESEMVEIRRKAVETLQKKYPNAGIVMTDVSLGDTKKD